MLSNVRVMVEVGVTFASGDLKTYPFTAEFIGLNGGAGGSIRFSMSEDGLMAECVGEKIYERPTGDYESIKRNGKLYDDYDRPIRIPEVIKVNYASVVIPAEELYRPGDEVVSITTSIGDAWVVCDGSYVRISSAGDGSDDDSGPGNEGLFITPSDGGDRNDGPDGRDRSDRARDDGMEL